MAEKNAPRVPSALVVAQIVALLGMFGLVWWSVNQVDSSRVPYSEFKALVAEGSVAEVQFEGELVRAKLSEDPEVEGDPERATVESVVVPGDDSLVDGEGVVGEQPVLAPGESHEYQSYCVLRSPVGFMEGHYTFVRDDGQEFKVEVPRFHLNGPLVIPTLTIDPYEGDDEPDVLH